MTETKTTSKGPAPRKTFVGVVKSNKMNQTIVVTVERMVKHPEYGKYIKRRTICYMHDEQNETHMGDTVEIMETRPLSKSSQSGWSRRARGARSGSTSRSR
jgi:small subunit ribosomal protein S17